jgi:Na+-driven multidrug efflux pump
MPMHILLPGILFLGVGAVVTGNLRGLGRPGVSSLLAGLTVIVTLSLDLALIPAYGVTGAAVASSVAYAVYGSASVFALSRLTGTPIRLLSVPQRADLRVYARLIRAAAAGAGSAASQLVSRLAR